jgi:hypothetical protein
LELVTIYAFSARTMVRMACCNALGLFSQTLIASLHLDNAQQAITRPAGNTRFGHENGTRPRFDTSWRRS